MKPDKLDAYASSLTEAVLLALKIHRGNSGILEYEMLSDEQIRSFMSLVLTTVKKAEGKY